MKRLCLPVSEGCGVCQVSRVVGFVLSNVPTVCLVLWCRDCLPVSEVG